MRLGLLADIHEDVRRLTIALARLRREQVDRIVVLGDLFETGASLDQTVDLLAEVGAIGVWGNHDIGLCWEPTTEVRARYAGPVLDFMATLQPRMEVGGCWFTHVLPWLDPTDPEQPWYLEGPPLTPEAAAPCFAAATHRVIFTAHFHRWLIASPTARSPWDGQRPITLSPDERHLIVVAAVCDGWCAVFDTDTNELYPYDLKLEDPQES
jgi:hypothetical protein